MRTTLEKAILLWYNEHMNTCTTYFAIRGDFDPDEITQALGVLPQTSKQKTESAGGKAIWTTGRNDEYDPIVAAQMKKTIAPLADKTQLLAALRRKYNARLTVEAVVTLDPSCPAPALGADGEIVEFCHATGSTVDIDLYFA